MITRGAAPSRKWRLPIHAARPSCPCPLQVGLGIHRGAGDILMLGRSLTALSLSWPHADGAAAEIIEYGSDCHPNPPWYWIGQIPTAFVDK
jgi:hypothetical protein